MDGKLNLFIIITIQNLNLKIKKKIIRNDFPTWRTFSRTHHSTHLVSAPMRLSTRLLPTLSNPLNSVHFVSRYYFTNSTSKSPSLTPMAAATPKTSIAAVDMEEGIARRFWIKFRKEATFSMYAPFVVCLASGNLKLDSFRQYIAQDVHFLSAFAQA